MLADIEHVTIETNGIELHAVQSGPVDGAPVLLLHGFPEFWYGWRSQIPALAAAGYRVTALDQRGYNLSEKPPRVRDYRMHELVADVVGVIEWLNAERIRLVAHDWGGAVAWQTARYKPERVARMVVMNMPDPRVMMRHVRRSLRQSMRSWYILFFQLPVLPEFWFRNGGGRWMMRASSRENTFTADDMAAYQRAWSQPGALRATINWYRAALRPGGSSMGRANRIAAPTMLIWGRGDTALGQEMAEPSIAQVEAGRLIFIDEATHWVQHDAPEQVNRLILEWLSAEDASG